MTTFVRFRPNPIGINALDDTREMGRAMADEAESAANSARSIAPRRTGAYAASIHVEQTTVDGKSSAQVVASVPYADFVEFGTGDTPAFAPLRRGAQNAGLRLSG